MKRKRREFSCLLGLTMKSVTDRGNEEVVFVEEGGRVFRLYHQQDCCEVVRIEEIVGDLNDLIGAPILVAEESSNDGGEGEWGGTSTWTFYRLSAGNGLVSIRWKGESNGYYSESVDFEEEVPEEVEE